jgi:hypothetical protein
MLHKSRLKYTKVNILLILYLCETLTLWTEQRLRVFENRMLRRKFGLKKEEVTTGCRKVNNVQCHAIYTPLLE